ncbi:phospholipid-transporting ATPase ABCA3-like [Echinops telfairi]|uniref:Phospholipid-transporting ATPase ABCA3-like n=1 Tax=Echinops telfairi TaxID=9371 RepID=A0AC55CQT0_ECHTE|nr:phospholipid-transporting ATPase ABCA3-like [Echinops telfairi]
MNFLTFNQFAVLLWKNLTLKRRQFIHLVLEIVIVLAFGSMLLIFREVFEAEIVEPYNYTSRSISTLPSFLKNPEDWELIYVPSKADVAKEITENVKKNLNISIKVRGFSSETEFETYIKYDYKSEKVLAAIVFEYDFQNSSDPLPLQVKYHLRFNRIQRSFRWPTKIGWQTSTLFADQTSARYGNPSHPDSGSPGYIREGFLAVQYALDKSIMLYHESRAREKLLDNISIFIQRFPRPASYDVLLWVTSPFFPFLFVLMFSPSVLSIMRLIVWEKENGLKEYQLIIGLRNWIIWAAYFFTFFLIHIIIISLICVLFFIVNKPIFCYSDYSFIFVFLMCYTIASIFFSLMVSTFFNKVNVATSVGSFLYFASLFPFNFIVQYYGEITLVKKVISCLSSNVALALGINLLLKLEMKLGVKWDNLWTQAILEDNLIFGYIFGMLLLDAFLYGLVTWYIETVFPGQYGVPQPWYFFLKRSYWFGNPRMREETEESQSTVTDQSKYFEAVPPNLVPGIYMRHLSKEYHDKVAVDDLTWKIYPGQITVLLGQNGAGKSTTLSILTGLHPPTRGEAYINGYDISKNIAHVRKNLGFCPQHDLLFNDLTLSEHLFFYCMIKGIPQKMHHTETDHMLSAFNLLEKRDAFSQSLNRGMKRKLSIIIALIGGSKVVVLDEPSSGMDPASRRATWDILRKYKQDRTILLTTHYMDEADILGDRIAIMVRGSLQCCGSSIFLKQIYGAGYQIVMEKKLQCDVEGIIALIDSHVPQATLDSNTSTTLSFYLPKEDTQRFATLFHDLDQKQEELGIARFGASITTMEQVFLKVNKLAEVHMEIQNIQPTSLKEQNIIQGKIFNTKLTRKYRKSISPGWNEITTIQFNTGLPLYCQQFRAMLTKRVLFTRRHWKLTLLQILVIVCVTTYLLKIMDLQDDLSTREMDLSQYGRTIVPYSISGKSPLALNIINSLKIYLTLKNQELREVQDAQNTVYTFEEHGIAKFLITLAVMGLFFLLLILYLESSFYNLKAFVFNKIIPNISQMFVKANKSMVSNQIIEESEDEGVKNERKKVWTLSETLQNPPLYFKELTKIYYTCPIVKAVSNISLVVEKSECFGLLGLNEAGKSATIKMLTGEEAITSGVVLIDGINITENIQEIRSRIGYCPQSDPLLNYMTGRELLIMYARLWGVPEPDIYVYVQVFLHSMHLEMKADSYIYTYSGGNKRRLSTVIALMGRPSVIFLDDPSAGMDPVGWNLVRNTVTRICKTGKAIIMTSQSMEECEALCTRLAIMVKGRFTCIGSPQQLKNKFGNVYNLKAKINMDKDENKVKEFKEFIATTFPGSIINQEHQGILDYCIPSDEISWGKVFCIFEDAKLLFNLEDYSISQIKLEQIFLTFANIDKTENYQKIKHL